jgi:transposase
MDFPAIYSATLGLHPPWHIVSVSFAREERRMDVRLDVFRGNLFNCPCCGAPTPPCSFDEEVWSHDDFFGYSAYLHACVPRIACCGATVAVERPWCRAGSRFVRVLKVEGTTVSVTVQQPAEAQPAAGGDQPAATAGSANRVTTGPGPSC